MAHVLNTIRMHQALHGYSDGHRLLASSASLKPRDLKTMLVMSDVSGPSAVIGDDGYLTGYPLTDSGVYAFACTWAATEMARPGCVWTHTLLIDFSDLAVFPSMNALQTMFRRPAKVLELGSYEQQITLKGGSPMQNESEAAGDTLKRVLWALYEHPKAKVIASGDDQTAHMALSIWAQQWPRLRRTFRFCTLSFGDRSNESNIFDLQFIPKRERSIRLRFTDNIDADRQEPSNDMWMFEAMLDLSKAGDGSLRRFLREVGGDVTSGREAFAPLCRLHYLLARVPDDPQAIDQAIALLESSFDSETARSLRTVIVRSAVRHLERLGGGRAVDFLLEHLEWLDSDGLGVATPQLGRLLWFRDPKVLIDLLFQPLPRAALAQQALAGLPLSDLIEGLQRQPAIIPTVVQHRPELLNESGLWQIRGAWVGEGLRIATSELRNPGTVLAAIISARRTDIAADVANAFGGVSVLKSVCSITSASVASTDTSEWLAAVLSDSRAVAEFLSTDSHLGTMFLTAIARKTYPDFVPNDYGEDPWWTALCHVSDNADESDKEYLSAYLLARALGYRSRNQAELMAYAFDTVYIPALHSRLSGEAWSVLDRRLPDSWFFDWDNCRRMRDGIVGAFVDRDLSPLCFARLTRDDRVFKDLAELAERTGRGRRFLKSVRQSLKKDDPTSQRIGLLDSLL